MRVVTTFSPPHSMSGWGVEQLSSNNFLSVPLLRDEVSDDGLPFVHKHPGDMDSISSAPSAEGSRAGGTISVDELAELASNNDLLMLQTMGGVEGVAKIISLTVNREMDVRPGGDDNSRRGYLGSKPSGVLLVAGAKVADAAGMPRNTEETRRRLFGRNNMSQNIGGSCGFVRLLLGCLSDDPMVVFFAAVVVTIALGLIQCVPIYIAVPLGDVHLRRCPPKPLWARHESIRLPHPAHFNGGASCKAWAEGLGLLVLGVVVATAKAVGEWWRQKRLFGMLDWCRSTAQATVIREGINTRVSFNEVLVGDIVLVAAGDMVCADGVLVESLSLKVDEVSSPADALLSGSDPDDENQVRSKNAVDAPFLIAGSLVLEGEAMFLVTAVGAYSNWEAVSTAGLGTKLVAKLVRDPVAIRKPLERLARLTAVCGRGAVALCMVLRICVFGVHMWTGSCFNVVVEQCAYGADGLNNSTLCRKEGYTWARPVTAFSSADLWEVTEAVMSAR